MLETVKFWIVVEGRITQKEGQLIWGRIQHKNEIHFTVLDTQAYVYGETSVYVLLDVLRQFEGYHIQLHID